MISSSRAWPSRQVWLCLLLPVLAVLMSAAPAWARTYHVSKFNSNIHVQADGSADVTEQITFVFRGQFQGVYRDIPVEYPGPRGTNYSLFITVNQVTDENGSSLKFEKSR